MPHPPRGFLSRIVCCAAVVLIAAAALRAGEDAAAPKMWRIMPVGDSITEGFPGVCVYRYPLYQMLTKAGYHFEYVGARVSKSPAGPLHHEGFSGKTAEYIASRIDDDFRAHPADIVLIHAGHNHFVQQHPVPGILEATRKIITEVRAVNPHVIILLAQVVTSGKLPKYSYIPQLNEQIPKLAADMDQSQSPIIVVDQAAGWDWHTDTIKDHVHPNEQGGHKMAKKWFDTLTKIMTK